MDVIIGIGCTKSERCIFCHCQQWKTSVVL